MEQLVFELALPELPRFANFLSGRNAELLAALSGFVDASQGESGMFIWGAPGAGKTHLLHAAVGLAHEHALSAQFIAQPVAIDDEMGMPGETFVAIDRIDEASVNAAARLFTWFNALKQRGGRLLAASRMPLATLALREDLRTRLGWGLVYEVLPLVDAEKPAALDAYARQRGFALSVEVIDYLLRHGRRDMPSLLATLAALDRHSLATRRAITVPLLREWLQRETEWQQAAPLDRLSLPRGPTS